MRHGKGMRKDALRTYQNFIDIADDWQKDDVAKAKERINALKSRVG